MPRARLRPAFVVTLAALAPFSCQKEPVWKNPAPPETGEPQQPKTNASQPPKRARARPVRDPLPPDREYSGQVDFSSIKHLSPRDPKHGAIFAARNGECYVEMQANPGGPIGPPGSGLVPKTVDCPDVMRDPAWDSCIGGEIALTASGECVCSRTGNPPPPPTLAECPKSVR